MLLTFLPSMVLVLCVFILMGPLAISRFISASDFASPFPESQLHHSNVNPIPN